LSRLWPFGCDVGALAYRGRPSLVRRRRCWKITVLDRSVLERLSCQCYAVVEKESDRLPSRPQACLSPAADETRFPSRGRHLRPSRFLRATPRGCAPRRVRCQAPRGSMEPPHRPA
jgi:hypothetical protein